MTKTQRAHLLSYTERQLDYWTPRMLRGENRESAEQHEYYTKFMKYLVLNCDDSRPILQNGPNLVFPTAN